MSIIGKFKEIPNGFDGYIKTLTITAKVRLIENSAKTIQGGADYKIFSGDHQIGSAWKKTSRHEDTGTYLSVRLFDPAFPEPIKAALFKKDDIFILVWRWRKF